MIPAPTTMTSQDGGDTVENPQAVKFRIGPLKDSMAHLLRRRKGGRFRALTKKVHLSMVMGKQGKILVFCCQGEEAPVSGQLTGDAKIRWRRRTLAA